LKPADTLPLILPKSRSQYPVCFTVVDDHECINKGHLINDHMTVGRK